jgi:phosphatidylglycerophosphatase C
MAVAPPAQQVAVFDLDGTLTWRDSFIGFLAGYLRARPLRWLRAWRLLPALLHYALRRDRGLLKQRIIQVFMGGDARAEIYAWAHEFVAELEKSGMRREALAAWRQHEAQGDVMVLLSASPDLYVPILGSRLRAARVICTEVRFEGNKLDGQLLTANRRGEEKLRVLETLRREFPHSRFAAYGNAASDLAHLARTDAPLLVNANAAARREASRLGIKTADWA